MKKLIKDEVLEIQEPYWSAGNKFHWPYDATGIGISMSQLKGDGVVKIRVGGRPQVFSIEKEKARELVERYQTNFNARSTKLGVIPFVLFKKVEATDPQQALF